MKCIHCQGEMKKSKSPFHVDRKSCHVTLEGIPSWVCEQCGESYFDEKEVDAIQDLIRSIDDKVKAMASTA